MEKPTVGILSMHRVINYGSYLQAYALKQLLYDNGAGDVFFIDIIPGRRLGEPDDKRLKYVRKLNKLTSISRFKSWYRTYRYQKQVEKSIIGAWPRLGLARVPDRQFDMVVIGSDEVFNSCQNASWGFSTQLFGDIPAEVARKIISYAGSFGNTEIENIEYYGIGPEIAENLNKLESISVRDINSASIVSRLTEREPYIHVDPVLAYGFSAEIDSFNESPVRSPYMLLYSYQDRIRDKEEIDAIRSYAREKGLKLICLYGRYDWCDEAVIPSDPIDVLRWFKFADCIVTDTFHGTIFSTITKSRFVTLLRPTNNNKLGYLLDMLALHDRAVTPDRLSDVIQTFPDYQQSDIIIENCRRSTSSFLRQALT